MYYKIINALAVLILISLMTVSIILLNSKMDYITNLPIYEDIESINTPEMIKQEYILDKKDLIFGFVQTGVFVSIDSTQTVVEYVVSKTNLEVADIVTPTDYIDVNQTQVAGVYGIVHALEILENNIKVIIYRFDNLQIQLQIPSNILNEIIWSSRIYFKVKNKEFSCAISNIDSMTVNGLVKVNLRPFDYNFDFFALAGMSVEITIEEGVIVNALVIPNSLNISNLQTITLKRDDEFFSIKIILGKIGFEYTEILSTNIKKGDILILD